jgi:acyl transferase domain-containing protein/acyl-CoA synthetase (AMP-forming)/AMP-acid ligase II
MSPEKLPREFATLVELLQWRAVHQANTVATIFLVDGEHEEQTTTYQALDAKARVIAQQLNALHVTGQPVLMLYPSGLNFIEAFFGILYAGAIAVPLYPPHRSRADERLSSVIADCGASLFLTEHALLDDIAQAATHTPALQHLKCLATDTLITNLCDAPDALGTPSPGDIAFLQYTSGSTQAPKGVMVSHRNLMANLERINQSCAQAAMRVVGWLPMFHDMGLISNTLEPLYLGAPLIFMAPVHFLQRPIRWLQAISRYQATTSGGPNFAYELCISKTTPQEREGLDLSHWGVAFNGAEPVRWETLERFSAAFAPHGFRREAFFPCYGLAEATILVASAPRARRPVSVLLDQVALADHRVRVVDVASRHTSLSVGCGQIASDESVLIVNPETLAACGPNSVGEVWVASASVTQGYWNQPQATHETFGARLMVAGRRDHPDSPDSRSYLRTGDLGFILDNELFLTGRHKDLIILRGRNHYPQDIEHSAEAAHAALRRGCSAAFSHERNGQEHLVIVFEVERKYVRHFDLRALCATVRRAVFEAHGVLAHALCVLKPGGIPKTSSGKIRRAACQTQFSQGALEAIEVWREDDPPVQATQSSTPHAPALALQTWLQTRLAEVLNLTPQQLDIRRPFADYGVDSVLATQLSGELESLQGRRLPATLLYEFSTIEKLAHHLSGATSEPAHITPTAVPISPANEPIAIIGMSCRWPGAEGLAAFWDLLCAGLDAVTEVPPERWPVDDHYDAKPQAPGKMNTRRGGFLRDIDLFDENFFHISPREAAFMDPQQRLLLELAHEALEDAGIPLSALKASPTSVFVGICNNDYATLLPPASSGLDPRWVTGNAFSIAANRISYFFDLKGPSMAVDTACSSSLVAVHLACQSLRSGEATLALAGGVNLILRPDVSLGFSAAMGTSPDGRCKAFSAAADGMVRSEGAAWVVLKPLAQAHMDGDRIYAVIPGSAVNHDGLSNGLTAPSQAAQEQVIRQACRNAGRSPAQIQYVEAHGTGTLLGDPIEAFALGAALVPEGSQERLAQPPVALGSVKSNIGHAEAAAGMASLIKVALALRHQHLPATLFCDELNPHIPFETLGLRVQTTAAHWPRLEQPRLGGVSGFGFGGTNAHVLLEEPPAAPLAPPWADSASGLLAGHSSTKAHVLAISARTPLALRELAQAYLQMLECDAPPLEATALCAAAALRREHWACRLAIVFVNGSELRLRLQAFVAGDLLAGVFCSHPRIQALQQAPTHVPKIAFVFSGHRGQPWSLSRDFLQSEPVFLQALQQCAHEFAAFADWPLIDTLCGELKPGLDPLRLDVQHPCQLAYQVAMVARWRSLGVEPQAVVGHSFGEVAAAHVAGVLSLPDAVRIIFLRSRCLQKLASQPNTNGAMATVEMPLSEVQAVLDAQAPDVATKVAVAVNNGPSSVVLCGPKPALEKLLVQLKAQQIFCNLLDSPGAGHHPSIDANELGLALQGLQTQPAKIKIMSSVLGRFVDGREMGADYWVDNIRRTVRFAEAIAALAADAHDTYIEIAPYPPLLNHATAQSARAHCVSVITLPALRRQATESVHLYGSLAALYAHGHEVDWARLYAPPAPHVALPSYPWQRKRFWAAARPGDEAHLHHPRLVKNDPIDVREGTAPSQPSVGSALSRHQLLSLPTAQRLPPLLTYLQTQLAKTLEIAAHEIDLQRPINTLGIDSLMALELKNRVEADLHVALPIVQFLEGATVREVASLLLLEVEKEAQAPSSAASPTPDKNTLDNVQAAQLLTQVDEMSDAEVESLLAALEGSDK